MEENNKMFNYNRPSIIDLYANDEISFDNMITTLENSILANQLSYKKLNDKILKVTYNYNDFDYHVYLTIVDNKDKYDLSKINKVLTDEDIIQQATNVNSYIKSYVDIRCNYVSAYYTQIKLLAVLTNEPLLIVDCSQWCIYSEAYLKQVLHSNVEIIDSNLFKVKLSKENTLYTEGLERFGIKDIEMINIESKYQKNCAAFLSKLSRYFIENGQAPNTCMAYHEVFEKEFYACLIDIEQVIDVLKEHKLVSKKRDQSLNENRLLVSVHASDDVEKWYTNDEEVLSYLNDSATYYTSLRHFEDEKLLAQETLMRTIHLLEELDDQNNLMIFARNNNIETDWYYFRGVDGDKIRLEGLNYSLITTINNVINWNYRGVTPLYAYSLEK